MTSLFLYITTILIFFLFLYFIFKENTLSSFIARFLLTEIILFFIHFISALVFEPVFVTSINKYFLSGSDLSTYFLVVVGIILVTLFCFYIFNLLVFLLLGSMALPQITYSSKIAPVMSVVAGLFLFFFSFDSISIVFSILFIAILSPFVFADHDYKVKLKEIELFPDLSEISSDELKNLRIQRQNLLKKLNASYKRNIFVRINRRL